MLTNADRAALAALDAAGVEYKIHKSAEEGSEFRHGGFAWRGAILEVGGRLFPLVRPCRCDGDRHWCETHVDFPRAYPQGPTDARCGSVPPPEQTETHPGGLSARTYRVSYTPGRRNSTIMWLDLRVGD